MQHLRAAGRIYDEGRLLMPSDAKKSRHGRRNDTINRTCVRSGLVRMIHSKRWSDATRSESEYRVIPQKPRTVFEIPSKIDIWCIKIVTRYLVWWSDHPIKSKSNPLDYDPLVHSVQEWTRETVIVPIKRGETQLECLEIADEEWSNIIESTDWGRLKIDFTRAGLSLIYDRWI